MSFDLKRILASKQAWRRSLAMLDALREQASTIRQAGVRREAAVLHESPPEYRGTSRKD